LTKSISRGIGAGFISEMILHFFFDRSLQVPATLYLLATTFALNFWLERENDRTDSTIIHVIC